MPKLFGRNIHPVVLFGGTALALYLVMVALQAPPPDATTKRNAKPVAKANTDVEYTKGDYTASFATLSTTPKDAFRPLLMKSLSGPGNNPNIDNFTYSGMAKLNGVANGLLENSTTGEGDFVTIGEHWHQQWLVVSMTPDDITLRNDVGEDTNLKAGTNEKTTGPSTPGPAMQGNIPINPTMIGNIGNGDIQVQTDTGANQGVQLQGGGRRRGGRRGGGGNGGGGYRGGGGGAGATGGGSTGLAVPVPVGGN